MRTMKNSKAIIALFAVAALAVAALLLRPRQEAEPGSSSDGRVERTKPHAAERARAAVPKAAADDVSSEESDDGQAQSGDSPAQEEMSEEERREAEDEKKVDEFDSLTDKWMEKEGGEVTMKDMDDFVAKFKSVPAARREECLRRALNLVSDDHVLLLAGILFDKSVEKEYVELVFNDVLNRDESVKKLILPKILEDRSHPCWADTAWILDVTGELPKKQNNP